jgi:translation initiation factor IF-3
MTAMAKFSNNNTNKHRINYQIRCPKVRLIINNRQMGIVPIEDARKFAQENQLDLVFNYANNKQNTKNLEILDNNF